MRPAVRHFCAFLFCLVVFGTTIQAQDLPDVAQGLQPYVAYHGGGLDSVSTLNGSLTVRIPLVSYPQKGSSLALSYSVIFNSFGFQEIDNCDAVPDPNGPDDTIPLRNGCIATIKYLPAGMLTSPAGPRFAIDQQLSTAGTREYVSTQSTNPLVEGRYYIVTPDLAQHPLGQASDGFRSVDESGYLFVPSDPTEYPMRLGAQDPNNPASQTSVVIAPSPSGGTITDSHGNLYTSGGITDKDGNAITFSAGGTTDSAGRWIPNPVSTDLSQCPTITAATSQPLVSASIWTIPGTGSGGQVTFIFCYATVQIKTNFPPDVASGNFHQLNKSVTMLQSIVLPNKQHWAFVYDSANPNNNPSVGLGQLTQLIYPTGGAVSYTYGSFAGFCPNNRITGLNPGGIGVQLYAQEVASRKMTDSDGTVLGTWNYTYGGFGPGVQSATGSIISPPSTLSPSGDITITKFTLDPNGLTQPDLYCSYNDAGKVVYQGASTSTTPLQETSITYSYPTPPGLPSVSVPRESRTTAILNGISSSTVTTSYDPGISFSEWRCDFFGNNCGVVGSGTATIGGPTLTTYTDFTGAVLKKEFTSYEWRQGAATTPYFSANLLNIPSTTQIQDASGNPVASTTYSYDDADYSPGGVRGHPTTISYVLNTGTSPTTYTRWNNFGQKTLVTDARGGSTTYQYNQCNQSLLSDTYNALNHHTSAIYDCPTGLIQSVTDANSQPTSLGYDSMRRITDVSYPDSGHVHFDYNDPGLAVTETVAQGTTTTVSFDGFGREIQRATNDSPQSDKVDTQYDLNGRIYSVSNPYRTTSDPTYGSTIYVYDALGRKKTQTQQPDGTSQQWLYAGNAVTFTDETGLSWVRTSDVLGRLTNVTEPNGVATAYDYYPFGPLHDVTQYGVSGETPRTRSFIYDSLSRLTSATNPETGTILYFYVNGNQFCAGDISLPCSKTDARGISITYQYDALNRLTSKQYSGDGGITPSSCFVYDLGAIPVSNAIGRLVQEWTQIGQCTSTAPANNKSTQRSILGYDPMGRIQTEQRCILGNCKASAVPFSLTTHYDLAGHIKDYDNGLGTLTITNYYDPAARLFLVTSGISDSSHPPILYSVSDFTAAGALHQGILGGNIFVTQTYDSRLRPTGLTAVKQ